MYLKMVLLVVLLFGFIPATPPAFATTASPNPILQGGNGFDLVVNPAVQTIQVGTSTSFSIQIQASQNFNQPVNLSLTVAPSNAQLQTNLSTNSLTPGGTAVLTVNSAATTGVGTYLVTITGVAGSQVKTTVATVVVRPVTADFALALPSPVLTIRQKTDTKLTVNILRFGGFSGAVTVTGPDTKLLKRQKIVLAPQSQTTTGNSVVFNFNVQKKAVLGTYELIFSGTDAAGTIRLARLTIVVER
ncbi:MAG: hypothetical protein K1Y36_25275 [Blastocatellia bacterium]|nr:hypothetical protein [Blastocatellia bacterium]